MKDTLFIKIIKRWESLTTQEKLKNLQEFENQNAQFEDRSKRKIVLTELEKSNKFEAAAEYCIDTPDLILLNSNFANFSAVSNMANVFHEGFHAYVDDYFNRDNDLSTLSKVDENKLKEEYSLKGIIYNRATHSRLIPLFAVQYYEEKLVRDETCLYLIYNLLKSCESENDFRQMFKIYYYDILGLLFNYQTFCQSNNLTEEAYQKSLYQPAKNLDAIFFREHILDPNSAGKISSGVNPALLKHLEKNYNLFKQSQLNARNPQLTNMFVNAMLSNMITDSHTI